MFYAQKMVEFIYQDSLNDCNVEVAFELLSLSDI